MISFFRRLFKTLTAPLPCRHEWEPLNGNAFKRICKKCGEEQWLMGNPIWSDKPALTWESMRRKETAKFLAQVEKELEREL